MDINSWKTRLEQLPLGDLYLHQELGSTNVEAEAVIEQGARPFSLVLVDSQTAGKGRQGRNWVTRKGKALAFSWILYPEPDLAHPETLGLFSGLGALAVAEVLNNVFQLPAEIKWPNDVLVEGKKVAGVLVDVHWAGSQLKDVVLGIGVNVARGSVPDNDVLNFPATSLEEASGKQIPRLELLVQILESLINWFPRLSAPEFLQAWDSKLAYRGQMVKLVSSTEVIDQGILNRIGEDGSLILLSEDGKERRYHTGEIQLRLVDRF